MIDAPLALAFTAGVVAAFNPCGFAMLPAYLSYFVGVESSARPDADGGTELVRAVAVGAVVTLGFVAVFGIAGLAFTRFSLSVQRYTPWLTLVIGAALVPLGLVMLVRGWQPRVSLPRFQRGTSGRGLDSMFLFGVSYAVVSLSCTLPVFLVTVSGTFERSSFLSGLSVYVAYALGMGLVLMVLTVALGLARHSFVKGLRRVLPHVNRASGALLTVAGLYVAYYGWYELRLHRGDRVAAGPVDVVTRWSSDITNRVQSAGGLRVGAVLGALVATALVAGLVWRARSARDEPAGAPR